MSLLVNGAGASAANPILHGLRVALYFGASTMDIAQINEAYVDPNSTFPGTNSVRASLSPAHTVMLAGVAGSYDDTGDVLTVSSTTGLTAGDGIYLSHASITDGIYVIATVASGTTLTLRSDPFAGGGNQTNIAYQVAWKYEQTAGTAPIVSSGAGTQNFFKADVQDGAALTTEAHDNFYVRTAPSGADYISLDGVSYLGSTFNDVNLTLAVLGAWANKGGIATVELINHSVQAVNNFTFGGGGTSERAIATAESQGLVIAAGDGAKYGAVRFRSLIASSYSLDVDISATLDTSGPSVVFVAFGA
jgi:hypothetical protein